MKKILLSLLCICVFSIGTFAEKSAIAKEVELKKAKLNGPCRAPALNPARFNATLSSDMLTITAQNYTGAVQVQITGAGGSVFNSFYTYGAAVETVPLTTLSAGNYTISLITESGTYTGNFVL